MRTELQRQTARLNGARSRGPDGPPLWGTEPRTAAGKQRSSQNSRRHGLYSRSILSEAFPDPSESASAPQFSTPAETAVHLAYLEYMHVAALETRILGEEAERQRAFHPGESGVDLLARAWGYLCNETGVIEALLRLGSRASRRLDLAGRRLLRERTDRERCARLENRETNPAAPEQVTSQTPTAASAPFAARNEFYETIPEPAHERTTHSPASSRRLACSGHARSAHARRTAKGTLRTTDVGWP